MTGPSVTSRVTEVTVSAIPDDDIDYDSYAITVQWRGGETYAVMRHGKALGTDGEWDYELLPSSRDDEWIATHRFTYDRAYQLAVKAALARAAASERSVQ